MTRIALAIAAFAAAVCFGMPSSQAGQTGNAPWCAVQNLGMGEVEWDCRYASAAACAPNVTGGNRGFCNLNPYFAAERGYAPAPRYRHHHRYYR
ncbi:MAG: DUF3551 domain-containing protein [Xanthobacteraceae bacterium]